MQCTTAFIASAAALTASALPQTTPIAEGSPFGLITIRSGSAIQNAGVQAALESLLVNANSQNSTCDSETNTATFTLNADKELVLYPSATSNLTQTIFVDRSGMGMGKIGYVTGSEGLGRNWETKGWALENNELYFDGTGIQACPGQVDGGWTLWLQGVDEPAYLQNCTGVLTAAIPTQNPIGCTYSYTA